MSNIFLIFFIFLRIISNPIANVFQKKLSNEYSSFTINLYTYLILSIFCITKLEAILNFNYTEEFILLVLTAGMLCTLGMICMIKAVNIGELSVLGPINSYKSIVGLIIAFFLLKEIPSVQGMIGIILIVFGSRYIFATPNEKFTLSVFKRKDIQLRFLALTLTGIEAVLLKKIILISSVELCFIYWCFTGLFWSMLLMMFLKKSPKLKTKKTTIEILIIAVCLGLMQYSTNYVFEKMNVGFALAIFQLSSIVTVLFGYKIFHEENIGYKIIGSLIMIMGSCLILIN